MKNFKRDNALEKRLEHHLSGRWVRVYYNSGKRQGLWVYSFKDGKISAKGESKHQRRLGLWYIGRVDT